MFKQFYFISLFLVFAYVSFSQESIEQMEQKLDDTFGMDKLILLNQLSGQYQQMNDRKALKYGKQAITLAENIFPQVNPNLPQSYLKVDAYNILGKAQYLRERYYNAQQNFKLAVIYADSIGYDKGRTLANNYLLKLDSIGVKSNIFKETLNDINLGKTISSESQDLTISATMRTAQSYEKNGNYEKAIKNYLKAINYLKDKGDREQIAELYRKIADNYKNLGNIPKSMEYYNIAINEKEVLGDTTGLVASRTGVKELNSQIKNLNEIRQKDSVAEKESLVKLQTRNDYKKMAEQMEADKDYEKSLEYYKLYTELNDKIAEDEKEQELALLEKSYQIESNLREIQLLNQEKEIQDLEIKNKENEIEEQNRFRKNLLVGIVMLLALATALYLLYFTKRRDHRRLNVAHEDLKLTQGKLIAAEKKIKTLLDQQVSTEVAQALLSENPDKKIQRKLVCVMFLDIRGFTGFAESRKPEDIIQYQNDVFGFMIDSVYKHNGVINQFLGDGFMATFGAPVSKGNDSENALYAAIEIINAVNEKSTSGEIPNTRIGIGLHTGKVVVGNVGTDLRKQYSITGNAVIIAARIEQLNKKYGSQLLISEEVLKKIKPDGLDHEFLGDVQLKGRGESIKIYKCA